MQLIKKQAELVGKVDDTQKKISGDGLNNKFREVLESMSGEERHYYWLYLKRKYSLFDGAKTLTPS